LGHSRRRQNSTLVYQELTAVCLCGSLRTFAQPPVQRSFVDNLHYEGYEYFVVTDQPQTARMDILVAPIRSWLDLGDRKAIMLGRPNTDVRDELPRGRCPRGTCQPFRFLQPFARRIPECYYLMQAEEGQRRIRYSTVLRLRPDHLFLKRLPMVSPAAGWFNEPLSPGKVLLWDDQVSVSLREDAVGMLLTPSIVYNTCADEQQWRLAVKRGDEQLDSSWTMQKCRATGETPVTAMALISVFGGASRWHDLQQLRPRIWPVHQPDEVFCLKRQRWTADRPGRGNSSQVGLEC
jgi:hypothetical protein